MPRKAKQKKSKVEIRKEILSSPDSYKSLFYGIATVIVLFILGFSAVRMFMNRPKPEIDREAVSVSKIEQAIKETKDNVYTVAEGDTLWSIAETKYNDGFKWTEIAQANNLQDPGNIEKGTKLIIPVLAEAEPTPAPTIALETTPVPEGQTISNQLQQGQPQETVAAAETPAPTVPVADKIAGNSYTVKTGDDLWNIAERAYGDGYKWVDIARANNLADPDMIFNDNVLTIPR
ncbi:MAG: LysM peptidoglycan-binding domain-containing protein [Candidatus Levyibacteriota bacterium]